MHFSRIILVKMSLVFTHGGVFFCDDKTLVLHYVM